MTIKLILIGKTDRRDIQSLIDEYEKRLKRYIKFEIEVLADIKNRKNLSEQEQKLKEGEMISDRLLPADQVILLDENGKQFSSVDFARYLQKKMNSGAKRLVFIVGGPYGFSNELSGRSYEKMSLSKMTFSHQMIRPFFVEQIYRAFSILRNEPYHHQ